MPYISKALKVTNEEVLQLAELKLKFFQSIKRSNVAYLSFRRYRYEILQLTIIGKVASRRKAGRIKKSWLRYM